MSAPLERERQRSERGVLVFEIDVWVPALACCFENVSCGLFGRLVFGGYSARRPGVSDKRLAPRHSISFASLLHSLATSMLSSVAALTSGYTAPTALPQSRVAASMSMDIGGLKDMAKAQNPVVVSRAHKASVCQKR